VTSHFGRDRTSPISTRKSPEVRGLRDSIRDFGDYADCVVETRGLKLRAYHAVLFEPVSVSR